MRGTETTLAARRVTDVLAQALPDAELIEIDDAGHLSPITHPNIVNPLIVDGLSRNPGVSRPSAT
jgi:pimeloyl-ACP methyl ester carboxylesterase